MEYNIDGDNMKVLCVGNSAYDITYVVEHFPKENVKYKILNQVECGGGSCGNAAYLLAKWGIETYFVGLIGNDTYGKRIRDEFRTIGVKNDYLEIADNYETTTSHIIVNQENGSRTILSYHPNYREMNEINIDIVPDYIYLDGREYNMAKKVLESYPNAISIIDASNDRKDVKELCKLCNYVVCSKDFMKNISGIDIDNINNLDSAFKVLENEFNATIIVTLEELGSAYRNSNNEIVIIPSVKVKAIDTTGAGDIFHGAFTYGLIQGWNIEDILRFSNIAGAMSVTKVGGRNSMFELNDMLKVYNELR